MRRTLKAWGRLVVVLREVLRYRLDDALPRVPWLFRFLQGLLFFWPSRRRHLAMPYPERLPLALLALGPIFIKLGQALSTRYDMLPDAVLQALVSLQDQVPAIEGNWARERVEELLGLRLDQLEVFDDTPLAAASIAQVHAARLLDGTEVVVKLLRPHVHAQVACDVAWMRLLAKWGQAWSKLGKRLRLVEVVEEFARFTHDELDLRKEAANASQMRRAFLHSDLLTIPKVHWALCGERIMVMDRIRGIPIADVNTLRARGVNLRCLAERGVAIFFTQVLRDRFFHADMHPGNIFVDATNPERPKYIAVDFGIVGMLTVQDQRYLAENILAFFQQDYAKVVQLHVDSGCVAKDTDALALESMVRMACEPMMGQPLAGISLGKLLLALLQTAKQFEMQVQPQLLLLQKTLLSIEGLGKRLYPDLDVWATAEPLVRDWLKQQVGWRGLMAYVKAQGPFFWSRLLDALMAEKIKVGD